MRIVAIGGGEIGRPKENDVGKYPIETEPIDREIISLSGKRNPKLLFLPTASGDSEVYQKVVEDYYGKKLGCKVDTLTIIKQKYSHIELKKKILGSDIIYVGGGNTKMMLDAWKKIGVDKLIIEAGKKGIILSGVSAGAICWFRYGNSDSKIMEGKSKDLIKLKGLDLIPIMACPHYNVEKYRRPSLRKMIRENGGIAIALDNCSALEVVHDSYRIITSKKSANAYRLYKYKGKVVEVKIPKSIAFRPFNDLMTL